MRRADRLFQIIQKLRYDRPITASAIAAELEVSERTIYRDIQDLSLSGIPIISETGVGYRLMQGFQLPPLMFTEEELAALLLGARMVSARADSVMSRAAKQAIEKIDNVLPEHLKPELQRREILVPDYPGLNPEAPYLLDLRTAVKRSLKIQFSYTREDGQTSSREVLPLGIFCWHKVWTLVGWCELRNAFRQFRVDRIDSLNVSDIVFTSQPGCTLQDYLDSISCDE